MKRYGMMAAGFCLSCFMIMQMMFPSFAAEKISSVSLTVNADFAAGMYEGEEEIVIEEHSPRYHVDSWEFTDYDADENGMYTEASRPVLEITLAAEENAVFSFRKASAVRLKGNSEPEYLQGTKKDYSRELVLKVRLGALRNGGGYISECSWDEAQPQQMNWKNEANVNHEILVISSSDGQRKNFTVPSPLRSFDLSYAFLKPDYYDVYVRGVNPASGQQSRWHEGISIQISDETALANQKKVGYQSLDGYGWQKDAVGWWYKTPGGYKKSEWLEDNRHWFYMDERGYAVTGWREIDGKWYFFNESCEMLAGVTTPDGYVLGADGAMIP